MIIIRMYHGNPLKGKNQISSSFFFGTPFLYQKISWRRIVHNFDLSKICVKKALFLIIWKRSKFCLRKIRDVDPKYLNFRCWLQAWELDWDVSLTQTMSVKKNSITSVTILDRTVLFGTFCNFSVVVFVFKR